MMSEYRDEGRCVPVLSRSDGRLCYLSGSAALLALGIDIINIFISVQKECAKDVFNISIVLCNVNLRAHRGSLDEM